MEAVIASSVSLSAVIAMLGGRLVASRLNGHRLQQGIALVAGLIAIGMVAKVALAA